MSFALQDGIQILVTLLLKLFFFGFPANGWLDQEIFKLKLLTGSKEYSQ